MRRRIVAGNWKMNTSRAKAIELATAVRQGVGSEDAVKVVVCPPFPYLLPVADALSGSAIRLGAQDCYLKSEGAFTGEVSPPMLADVGCKYVILGHSERRHILGESDTLINQKLRLALQTGLRVILCVGETLQERQEGRMEEVFFRQLATALTGLSGEHLERLVIAYEPVWAIGTGHTATPQQAQDAHAWIRQHLARDFGDGAKTLPILYGGSVDETKAPDLFAQTDIDGGLIGGASLKPAAFIAIVNAAQKS